MGYTLCDRCSLRFRCALNYDGEPCRRNRDVEMTNFDRIEDMSVESLAEFLFEFRNSEHYDDFTKTKQDVLVWLTSECSR